MNLLIKVIVSIVVLLSLAGAFILPNQKIDTRREDMLRERAADFAKVGDVAGIKKCISSLSMPCYLADANASLAFAHHIKGDTDSQKSTMRLQYFNFDSYMTRALVFDILREPDFMRSLLEFKYIGQINEIKSDFDRAVPLYVLGVKMGEKGEKFVDEAFSILSGRPDGESRTAAVARICQISLERNRAEDFIRFLVLGMSTFEIDMLVLQSLKNVDIQSVWAKNEESLKRHNYLRKIGAAALNAVKHHNEEALKKILIYYPLRYNIKWKYNNFKDFNYPLYAYIAKLAGEEELYKKYLSIAKSKQLREKLYGDRDKYALFSNRIFKELGVENDAD